MAYKNYNADMNAYMKARWEKRRLTAIEYLGGVCVVCGIASDLEFDHIDPETKYKSIAKLSSASEVKFKAELDKCQLLCHTHHVEKHSTATHGSLGMWTHHRCRCDICTAAMRKYNREAKQRRKLIDT